MERPKIKKIALTTMYAVIDTVEGRKRLLTEWKTFDEDYINPIVGANGVYKQRDMTWTECDGVAVAHDSQMFDYYLSNMSLDERPLRDSEFEATKSLMGSNHKVVPKDLKSKYYSYLKRIDDRERALKFKALMLEIRKKRK